MSKFKCILTCFCLFVATTNTYADDCEFPNDESSSYLGYHFGISLQQFLSYAECKEVELKLYKSRDKRTKVTFYDDVIVLNSGLLPSVIRDPNATTSLRFNPLGELANFKVKWGVESKREVDELIKKMTSSFGRPTKTTNASRDSVISDSSWEFHNNDGEDLLTLFESAKGGSIWVTLFVESDKQTRVIREARRKHLDIQQELLKKSHDRQIRETNIYEDLF